MLHLLQLYVWRPEPTFTGTSSNAAETLGLLEAATQLRKACLVPIGSVDVRDTASLDDLQALVHASLNIQDAYLREELMDLAGSMNKDNFLLRELRADLLPGRSYWTSEAAGPAPTSTSADAKGASRPGSVSTAAPANPLPVANKPMQQPGRGKGAGNKPTTTAAEPVKLTSATPAKAPATVPVNTCGSATLKKLCLRGERGLVVELLQDSQARTRPPVGAFRVWVQELLNPGAAEVRSAIFIANSARLGMNLFFCFYLLFRDKL